MFFYNLSSGDYALQIAIALLTVMMGGAVLLGKYSQKLSFKKNPAVSFLVWLIFGVKFIFVVAFFALVVFNNGAGNLRDESLLQVGHSYFVLGKCEEQISGPYITVSLYDHTAREYLFWSFKKMPPAAFRVSLKNDFKQYDLLAKKINSNPASDENIYEAPIW